MSKPADEVVTHVSNEYMYHWQHIRRQTKPFAAPLDYDMVWLQSVGHWWDETTGVHNKGRNVQQSNEIEFQNRLPGLVSKTYEMFKNSISERSGWGENLAQLEKSREMVNNRANQLYDFAAALKSRKWAKAYSALYPQKGSAQRRRVRQEDEKKVIATLAKFRQDRKDFAAMFLEIHFGWQPLWNDIISSMQHLCAPVKVSRAQGSARDDWNRRYHSHGSGNGFSSSQWDSIDCVMRMRMSAEVSVSNPNLWLANNLGLINPVVTAYQVVPMSFLLDWFTNAEQVLSSVSDFYGLTMTRPITSTFWSGSGWYHGQTLNWVPATGVIYGDSGYSYRSWSAGMTRRLGLTYPSFYIKPFKGLSVMRGATAVALIVSLFDKTPRGRRYY